MPYSLMSVIVAAYAAMAAPQLPDLSDDPGVISVVDVVRVTMLIIGLILSAVTVRHAWKIPNAGGYSPAFVEGFRWRCWALAVGLVYVAAANYQRLGKPVTVTFVIGLIFLLFALRAVHTSATLPRMGLMYEDNLRDYQVPSVTPAMIDSPRVCEHDDATPRRT